MIKVVEIKINQEERLFDLLRSNLASSVEKFYQDISYKTNNFAFTSYEIFNPDIAIEYFDIANDLLSQIKHCYRPENQTYQMIIKLIKYFENN